MSEVDICNLALGHLGDTAAVMSIKPPDSSVQAQLCARFYPIARDALLEMHAWGFATLRVALALVDNPTLDIAVAADPTATEGTWQFAYGVPSDAINLLAVLPAAALDDYEAQFAPSSRDLFPPYPQGHLPVPGAPTYTPQPFVLETQANGTQIILTNVENAVLRYTRTVTDTAQFTPLFVLALSHLLASMLAGPIIKGEAGATMAVTQVKLFGAVKGMATASDANQRKTDVQPAVGWIRGR